MGRRFKLSRLQWIAAATVGVAAVIAVIGIVNGWRGVLTDPITWILAAAMLAAAIADHRLFNEERDHGEQR